METVAPGRTLPGWFPVGRALGGCGAGSRTATLAVLASARHRPTSRPARLGPRRPRPAERMRRAGQGLHRDAPHAADSTHAGGDRPLRPRHPRAHAAGLVRRSAAQQVVGGSPFLRARRAPERGLVRRDVKLAAFLFTAVRCPSALTTGIDGRSATVFAEARPVGSPRTGGSTRPSPRRPSTSSASPTARGRSPRVPSAPIPACSPPRRRGWSGRCGS